jgi:hypothetical protein
MSAYEKMKRTAAVLVVAFSCFGWVNSDNKTIETNNISGLWMDSNSSNFKNCYVIFAQDGNKIVMNHYLEFKGVGMVEYGIGTIDKKVVSYDVVVTKSIPGWAKKGKHFLKLNEDGTVLSGIFKDEMGKSGSIVFKKIK